MSRISAPWPKLKRDLIAILRGVGPDEVLAIGEELVAAGIEVIEVPLNSPDPFHSIETLAKNLPSHVLVGAGTVLDPADVERLAAAGGRLMISPNVDASVLAAAASAGMVTMPGVFTPTEALAALKAGASGLKFFPASVLGPDGIKAISAILPKGTIIGAVGGVDETTFADYKAVGIRTFGLGSSLYKVGAPSDFVRDRAKATVRAYDNIFSK
ncbi:2-dehydro-3-deoxy-6-phosphogalactonate aldolase [Phyllobacterium endophyticum]|uniref:2-dehydro-3-deoxy-6-phosphogalactonate aldolase n=1 Tax=Phyllobacterium endophyticum TaxID=1149773 RepID=A0A2P7ARN4_9HYPH|nr:2-dehydro-3-deoxy-6-phosphogalactonate aldolase [Phyllobacterium endophyticum]MBB3236569.1 2-dehydro-3-deoxyphosphogalactonate aldolase [Phyllobacterium endophyticum]PSH56891.1 2-dehydro-3-deoxy-6-phosphogalactonate aldolase [Phyllobacterium endophyticum]TYR39568.1 2-dehydro-3-deoxy-6-phosphogalactonate aldolase [Phyllobacterium endophyticum]